MNAPSNRLLNVLPIPHLSVHAPPHVWCTRCLAPSQAALGAEELAGTAAPNRLQREEADTETQSCSCTPGTDEGGGGKSYLVENKEKQGKTSGWCCMLTQGSRNRRVYTFFCTPLPLLISCFLQEWIVVFLHPPINF